MGAGAPVTVFDCPFNAEVVAGHARLFATPRGVTDAVEADELEPAAARARGLAGQERVAVTYRWDDVADGYEDLVRRLGAGATERRAAAWPPWRRG